MVTGAEAMSVQEFNTVEFYYWRARTSNRHKRAWKKYCKEFWNSYVAPYEGAGLDHIPAEFFPPPPRGWIRGEAGASTIEGEAFNMVWSPWDTRDMANPRAWFDRPFWPVYTDGTWPPPEYLSPPP
jgi:hypothetical protein